MPVRAQVRDAQRAIAALDANYCHAANRLEQLLAHRPDVLAEQDRLAGGSPSRRRPVRSRDGEPALGRVRFSAARDGAGGRAAPGQDLRSYNQWVSALMGRNCGSNEFSAVAQQPPRDRYHALSDRSYHRRTVTSAHQGGMDRAQFLAARGGFSPRRGSQEGVVVQTWAGCLSGDLDAVLDPFVGGQPGGLRHLGPL